MQKTSNARAAVEDIFVEREFECKKMSIQTLMERF